MALVPIIVDYETFWSRDYTLSKLTPHEYVFDERFELQTCSTQVGDGDPVFTVGERDTREFFETIDWDSALLIAHNGNEFDHLISRYRLGLSPRMWGDTIAMARPHYAKTGLSLAKLAEKMGLPAKGSLDAVGTKGKRLSEFTVDELAKMKEYNDHDTWLTWEILKRLMKLTSADDMRLIDATARMILYPQFRCDTNLLERGLHAERTRRRRLLEKLGVELELDGVEEVRKLCASQPRFKKLIEGMGVTVPMKPSKTNPEKEIPALAKTDAGMEELLAHEDPMVVTAAEVRLGVKSTQLENRIERFLAASEIFDGWLPIPLRFAGADTTLRFSGTFKLNMQNLPRVGRKSQISDVLRRSLVAPEGYQVAVADLSAIEMRVNHFLWKVEDTMRRMNADPKADLYKAFAAEHLYHIAEHAVSKDQRFTAKVAQLQLGYRSGWRTLQNAARVMSGGSVRMDDETSKHVTYTWRNAYRPIEQGWKHLDQVIADMHTAAHTQGSRQLIPIDEWGLCTASRHGIKTPKALLTYPQLHQRDVEVFGATRPEWFYKSSRGMKKLHGGIVCENICQHLAGQIMKDCIVAFAKTTLGKRYPLAHQVHDEAIYVVKDKDAQAVLDQLLDVLRTPPTWWPELVVWSEGAFAPSYGLVDK
jgi:hypothetical protein